MFDRRFLSLLGNLRTIGLMTFLLSVPIGIPSALTTTNDPFVSAGEVGAWLFVGAIAQLALGAVVLCGNFLLRRRNYNLLETRVATIGVAVLAGAARGVVLAVLPATFDLPTSTPIAVRVVSSGIIFGLWLVIIGAALGANDRYRSELTSLVDELATHELQLRVVDDHHTSHQVRQVSAKIADASAPISTALGSESISRDYARTARLVQDAIEERLRPLSHQFWFDRAPVMAPPRSPLDFIRRVLTAPVPWRRAVPLMAVLLVWNSLVGVGWPLGLYAGLISSALVALIVITCTHFGREHRLPWNIAMYVLLLLLPANAEVAIVDSIATVPLTKSVHLLLSVAIPLAFVLGAIANTLILDREAMLVELRERIADDDWDEHLGELHRRQVESDVASFLHNTVQSRLLAASLQMQQAAAEGDHVSAEKALEQARDALDMAANASSAVKERPPRERMEHLALAWEGLAAVTIELPEVLEPESTWGLVAQAVDECVTNSVRHGRATRVDVYVRETRNAIRVTVDDNGEGISGSSGPGLGSTWIEHVSGGQWSLTASSEGGGGHVNLLIPTA